MAWFRRSDPTSYESRKKATQEWQAGRAGRVKAHRSRGIRKAADAGEAWERKQRNFG
jgi:hypothetical protein